jgi:hypothetical protein
MTDAPLLAEPTDKIDATDPIEPMDSTEPTEPRDRIEPVEQMDNREPLERQDHLDRSALPTLGSLWRKALTEPLAHERA